MTVKNPITPDAVHSILKKHILADGFEIVLDLEHSRNGYLLDAKTGKEYLDFFTFFASNPIGLNHPKLFDEDFQRRISSVAIHNPSNSDIYTTHYARFMETYSRVGIPAHLPHAFFVAGGALAVENALKVAFDWKVQKNFAKGYRAEKGHRIMHFEQAFHGRSGYTMSLTNTDPNKIKYFPKFDWPRIKSPKMRFPLTEENLRLTIADEQLALAQAERYFELYKDDIAAIILEPIQGEGGDNHFRPEFHQALRDMANRHEALLIYDEVQTGVGLTGKFWCHEHYVQPDILAFGKKAQVCGVLAGPRVDEVETNVFHVSSRINSTWGSNLVDMVRFDRYLEIIEEDRLVENAAKMGSYLLDKITHFTSQHEHLSAPRGKGLMCAFNFPDGHSRKAFLDACYKNGLIMLSCGETAVRFRPALSVSQALIDEGMDIIERSYLEALHKCPYLAHQLNKKPKEPSSEVSYQTE